MKGRLVAENAYGRRLMLDLMPLAVRIFRNNVGVLKDRFGNYIRYGLCNGSSDWIGWRPITITPDMVGKQVAVFLAIETKDTTDANDDQLRFLSAVLEAGGIALVSRDGQAVDHYNYIATWKPHVEPFNETRDRNKG